MISEGSQFISYFHQSSSDVLIHFDNVCLSQTVPQSSQEFVVNADWEFEAKNDVQRVWDMIRNIQQDTEVVNYPTKFREWIFTILGMIDRDMLWMFYIFTGIWRERRLWILRPVS